MMTGIARKTIDDDAIMEDKTQTRPAVSDELVIPKPAPGENVYPIYSQGVICGYIYSGGNQKTPKIFLNGENQTTTTTTEEKPTKTKNNDLKRKSCFVKMSVKTAKGTATQPVNPKSKKEKIVSSTGKTPVLPDVSRIEPTVLKANPSDKFNVPSIPAKQPNGDTVDLGSKGSALEDSISLPVFEVPSQLATTPANKNVLQMKNHSDVNSLIAKQNSNHEPSVVMTSASLCSSSSSSVTNLADKMVMSSNVAPGAKDIVILSPPLTTNCNQPIILASNNSALQPMNWLTAPLQPTWPNTVTYYVMPTRALGQSPVYLTSSANTLSTVLPTVTTPSLTTTTTTATTTVSTVDSSVVQLPSTTMTSKATPPVTMMASLKAIVPKSTFVQLPCQLSTSSALNKKIKTALSSKKQPTASQFQFLKILKQTHLENENSASEIQSFGNGPSGNLTKQQSSKHQAGNPLPALQSDTCSVTNSEKASKGSASFGSDTQSNEADRPAAELTKTVQEKTIDSNLSVKSCQTNKSEASHDAASFNSKENKSLLYHQSALLVPVNKKPRGRPRKPLVPPPKYERKQIPILPATGNNSETGPGSKSHGFNLLPSGNYVICFPKEADESALSGSQSETSKANLSQCETNKQLTCDKKNDGSERESMKSEKSKANLTQYETNKKLTCDKKNDGSEGESMKSKPSLCEEKEMHHLSSQNAVSVKTEPIDDDSDVTQEECGNWSDNCTSSASPFTANIQTELPCKEEKDSDNESTTIQEEENELVITSCFSLSTHTESHRKLIPSNSMNSAFDNVLFSPNKKDLGHESSYVTSVIQGENSTNVAEKIKLKECSIRLKQLNCPSNSLILPSVSSEENDFPCTKPAENGNAFCNSSPKKDELNIKTSDSSVKVSALPATGTKRSLEAPAKSILEKECLKKLKENYLFVDKTEIPALPCDINDISLRSKSWSVSKDFLLIPDCMNKSLKTSDKSLDALQSKDDSLVVDLTKDNEADTLIDGCIAFHKQQLYLLQLQMDQHKTALEKLKKAQIYLKDTK